jgi:hypothetical protein
MARGSVRLCSLPPKHLAEPPKRSEAKLSVAELRRSAVGDRGILIRMASLSNPRHEKFSQLVASGIKPTAAYISLGYSAKGAPQSANNLLKRADVRRRVDEILQAAAVSTVAGIAFDQQRVLNRLDILSHKAEDLGQITAAVRCEELIGKHRAMFIDRQVADVAISNGPSVAEILRSTRAKRLEAEAKKDADNPAPLTGQTDVIDPEG